MSALVIALLGAESTGKTTLAEALANALQRGTGHRVAWVPEWLRTWCEREGRTPRLDEQAAILATQHAHIAAAAATHDVVVADTTGVMTAVYHRHVFNDRSLEAEAAARHAADVQVTLLTALDLPWVADPGIRDHPGVREPIDAMVRELLASHSLPFSVVGGAGDSRLAQAVAALQPALRTRGWTWRDGLFTRLMHTRQAALQRGAQWVCVDCDDPACERRSRLVER